MKREREKRVTAQEQEQEKYQDLDQLYQVSFLQ